MATDLQTQVEFKKKFEEFSDWDMTDEKSLGESQIEKFFSGSTVLLTGGTGFLGKLIVEKLLRYGLYPRPNFWLLWT